MRRGFLLCFFWSGSALAQTVSPDIGSDASASDLIVVQGYKESLATATAAKRADNGIVEVIDAEGIADFPDLNLAEALQRVSGVAVNRDGGEGRSITVRGLSPDFTRVRVNGLEALATTGGKDQASGQGSANRGRGFDFQVFASELFNRVTVRKSQSAEVEEGSLGATVDLATAMPFDYDGFTAAMSAEQGYNDLSQAWNPRFTGLISNRWADGRLGALLSVAYSSRDVLEEGVGTTRWENPSVQPNVGGCFQSPGPCNSPAGVYSEPNSAWHPIRPTYERLDYHSKRLGITGAIQYEPTDRTRINLSGLYAYVDGRRRENYLYANLSRGSAQGTRQIDVLDYALGPNRELISATFNDVEIRSEERNDELSTEFFQGSLEVKQDVGERLHLNLQIGQSKSIQDNPVQTVLSFDRYDQDGYSYDYSQSQKHPAFDYGFDVNDPANWSFAVSNPLGEPSVIRMRPNRTTNRIRSLRFDATYDLDDSIKLKAGFLGKQYRFFTSERRRFAVNGVTDGAVPLPAGVTIADVSHLVTGIGRNLNMPDGTPTSWLAPDYRKLTELLGLDCDCINQYGDFRLSSDNNRANNRTVSERDLSGYIQVDFETDLAGMRLRGNIGARYARTRTIAGGFVNTSFVRIRNSYDDFLPALNLALEPRHDVVLRFAAAKVMARPQLQNLTPGGSINNTNRSLTTGNPYLKPTRAKALDFNVEWYPDRHTQLSLGLFYKDISSFVQTPIVTIPYSQTGFPDSLLSNGNTPDSVFQVQQATNTKSGSLKGFEIAAQRPFTFLPAPLDGFGAIANFTYVKSRIDYITNASANPPTTLTLPLVGLSKTSWNGTLYYERGWFMARVSGAYRSGYVLSVPGGNGNDARGKQKSFTLDANASIRIGDRTELTFQALNLTDVFDNVWIDLTRMDIEESTHTGRQFYVGIKYRL